MKMTKIIHLWHIRGENENPKGLDFLFGTTAKIVLFLFAFYYFFQMKQTRETIKHYDNTVWFITSIKYHTVKTDNKQMNVEICLTGTAKYLHMHGLDCVLHVC